MGILSRLRGARTRLERLLHIETLTNELYRPTGFDLNQMSKGTLSPPLPGSTESVHQSIDGSCREPTNKQRLGSRFCFICPYELPLYATEHNEGTCVF